MTSPSQDPYEPMSGGKDKARRMLEPVPVPNEPSDEPQLCQCGHRVDEHSESRSECHVPDCDCPSPVPSDSAKDNGDGSAIGDKLEAILGQFYPVGENGPEDEGAVLFTAIKSFFEEQTKLARVKYERSGMAFVHSTVLDLFDDQKALKKLDKIVQERLADLEASIKERSEG